MQSRFGKLCRCMDSSHISDIPSDTMFDSTRITGQSALQCHSIVCHLSGDKLTPKSHETQALYIQHMWLAVHNVQPTTNNLQ